MKFNVKDGKEYEITLNGIQSRQNDIIPFKIPNMPQTIINDSELGCD